MNIKKYLKKNAIILIVLTMIFITGAGLFIAAENQINNQKLQIAILQKTIKNNNTTIDDKNTLLKKITGTNSPFEQAYDAETGIIIIQHPGLSPTPTSSPLVNPHSGMKEVKGMNCQPEGNHGATNCTEYDYWYNPNAAPAPARDWSNIKSGN